MFGSTPCARSSPVAPEERRRRHHGARCDYDHARDRTGGECCRPGQGRGSGDGAPDRCGRSGRGRRGRVRGSPRDPTPGRRPRGAHLGRAHSHQRRPRRPTRAVRPPRRRQLRAPRRVVRPRSSGHGRRDDCPQGTAGHRRGGRRGRRGRARGGRTRSRQSRSQCDHGRGRAHRRRGRAGHRGGRSRRRTGRRRRHRPPGSGLPRVQAGCRRGQRRPTRTADSPARSSPESGG